MIQFIEVYKKRGFQAMKQFNQLRSLSKKEKL